MTRTIDVALTQLGVREATGANDGVPAERYMRGDMLPWCAGFILWCNAQSTEDTRIATTVAEEYAWRNVEALEMEMRRRNWWIRHDALGIPNRNSLVFFGSRAGSDGGGSHHVGIIDEATPDFLLTIDGNYGNKVAHVRRTLADPAMCITGYARIPPRAP